MFKIVCSFIVVHLHVSVISGDWYFGTIVVVGRSSNGTHRDNEVNMKEPERNV